MAELAAASVDIKADPASTPEEAVAGPPVASSVVAGQDTLSVDAGAATADNIAVSCSSNISNCTIADDASVSTALNSDTIPLVIKQLLFNSNEIKALKHAASTQQQQIDAMEALLSSNVEKNELRLLRIEASLAKLAGTGAVGAGGSLFLSDRRTGTAAPSSLAAAASSSSASIPSSLHSASRRVAISLGTLSTLSDADAFPVQNRKRKMDFPSAPASAHSAATYAAAASAPSTASADALNPKELPSLQSATPVIGLDYHEDKCITCGSNDVKRLLLCDACPIVQHAKCAGLISVPHGEWFCARCSAEQCASCGTGPVPAADSILCGDGVGAGCDATFHLSCVGLQAAPEGDWFCAPCLNLKLDPQHRQRRQRVQNISGAAGGSSSSNSSSTDNHIDNNEDSSDHSDDESGGVDGSPGASTSASSSIPAPDAAAAAWTAALAAARAHLEYRLASSKTDSQYVARARYNLALTESDAAKGGLSYESARARLSAARRDATSARQSLLDIQRAAEEYTRHPRYAPSVAWIQASEGAVAAAQIWVTAAKR